MLVEVLVKILYAFKGGTVPKWLMEFFWFKSPVTGDGDIACIVDVCKLLVAIISEMSANVN